MICSAQLAVGVLPAALSMRSGRPFVEKRFVTCEPVSEVCDKCRLGCFVQCARKPTQFLPRKALRRAREVLGHGLHLVKLAVLHRNAMTLKNLCYASPAVNDGSGDLPATVQQASKALVVYCGSFGLDFRPTEIALECRRTEHTYAIPFAPECGVRPDDSWLWRQWVVSGFRSIQLRLHPAQASVFLLGKLRKVLSFENVLVVQRAPFCLVSAF